MVPRISSSNLGSSQTPVFFPQYGNRFFPYLLTSTWLVALFHVSLFACLQMIVSHPLCGGLGGWCVLDLQNSHLHPPAKHKSATRPGQFMSCQISLLSGFRYYLRFSTRVCGGQKRSPHRLGTGPACHGISPPPIRHRKLQGSKGEARPVFHSLCSVHSTHQVTRKAKLKGRKKEAKRGTVAMARCCLCPPKLSRGAMQRLGFFVPSKGDHALSKH